MKLKLLFTFFIVCASYILNAQQVVISGTVTDAKDGTVLPGVTVIVDKTNQGTVTDVEGKFSIKQVNPDATLVFSFLGYTTQKVTAGNKTVIDVSLQEDVMKLDEVVVTGYGTSKKKDLTGALTSVKGDDISKTGVSSPEQMLQGKVTGVLITSNNGEPGAGSQIKIRGASSIRANQDPLYVIDGILIDGQATSPANNSGNALNGAPSTSPLTGINPNDIESIDILKDASATAIYGSRGGNGVIIITTKRGKEGASEVNYSTSVSLAQLPKELKVLSGPDWVKARYDTVAKTTTNNLGANTNWQDQIFRTAVSQDQNLSLSGGTTKTSYRVSLNYNDQQGIIKTSELTRYAGNLNFSQKALNDKILFETNLHASQVIESRPPVGATGYQGDLLLNALQTNPTFPVKDSLGNPFQGNSVYTFSSNDRNPVAMLDYTSDITRTTSVLGGVSAIVNFTKDLSYKVNFGVSYTNANRFINQSQKLVYEAPTEGNGQINNKELYNYLIEHTLNYSKTFGSQSLNLLAGYSYQKYNEHNSEMTGANYPTDQILYTNVIGSGNTQANWSISSDADVSAMQSYFGRGIYNLMEKYIITATLRADGSTKFGVNKKYGYFPSFAAGWRMSEEDFIKNLNIFTNLKLRLGWGQVGNSDIGTNNSQYIYTADAGSKAIIGTGKTVISGFSVKKTPDPDITWETTTSTDVGLDFAILKGKLSGTLDLFQKTTSNLLLEVPSAPLSPTATIVRNIDSVKILNSGLELGLTGIIVSNKDFSWEISGNISFLSNKVTGLNTAVYPTGTVQGQGVTGTLVQIIANNQPINEFYGKRIDSIDKKGTIHFLKAKNKSDSLTYLGNPQPKFTYSITNNFKFKNFDLNIFFNGVYGNKIFNNTAMLLDKQNLNQSKNALSYFVNDNTNSTNATNVSNRYIEDGSYFRLSNITLGYNVNIKTNPWIKNVRIYVSGSNLFVITPYKGYDPDVSSTENYNGINSFGIDITNYPKARTYAMGLNVTF